MALSATIIGAARRALARAQPHASARELDLRFVELHYGVDVAASLRADLEQRDAPARCMTESDLVAALRPVADAFDALGVRYYIGGSVASSAHGIARASLDADLVAALEPDHVDSLVTRLASAYYIPLDRLRSAVTLRSSCHFIHLATMFKISWSGHWPTRPSSAGTYFFALSANSSICAVRSIG